MELIKGNFLRDINAEHFDNIALEVFKYQYGNNELYRSFTDALHISPSSVTEIGQVPFLPISFFKTHKVSSGAWQQPAYIFESSGTTGSEVSKHCVRDVAVYEHAMLQGFQQFYGAPQQYVILALLPSYLERKNSSLVHMARTLMQKSGHPANGFYLDDRQKLYETLQMLEDSGQQTLLLGVTFALLDFAEKYPLALKHTIVMETGGMKGRREEMTRPEVHDFLKERFNLSSIHSEYGMTELLSQAYARYDGLFEATSTMKVLVRDVNDPLEVQRTGTGPMNIIDLANIHSCSFIATEDIGKIAEGGRFEVMGRMDHAMLRGCSLMII